jgi:hypothetical protein
MTKEHRRNTRISCSIPVLLKFKGTVDFESWGVIFDVSLGGFKFETMSRVSENDETLLSFKLGDGCEFEDMRGKVAHVSPRRGYYVVGIAFREGDIDRERLRAGLFMLVRSDAEFSGQNLSLLNLSRESVQ